MSKNTGIKSNGKKKQTGLASNNINQALHPVTCDIEIQTIFYQTTFHFTPNHDINDNVITLYFSTLEDIDDCGSFYEFSFSLEQGKKLVDSLKLAINYVDELETNNQFTNQDSAQILQLPLKKAKQKRLKLIHKFAYSPVSEVLVDVVQTPIVSSPLVRLILPDYKIVTYGFTKKAAQQFIDGMNNALEYLKQNPTQIISDIFVGKVIANTAFNKSVYLQVGVDGICGMDQPRSVFINIYDGAAGYIRMSRWFTNQEILIVPKILEKAASEVVNLQTLTAQDFIKEQHKLPINFLVTSTLMIAVDKLPNDAESLGIKFVFKDEYSYKIDNNDVFWLIADNARELSKLMTNAFAAKKTHPAHKLIPNQPTTLIIANLPLSS
ncbi:MAG: hypothetical protein QNJ47_27255 [Nostocaceae cyanobacterium]|nr:hypothetical protein [Nostocaceae cyanobacterium]